MVRSLGGAIVGREGRRGGRARGEEVGAQRSFGGGWKARNHELARIRIDSRSAGEQVLGDVE